MPATRDWTATLWPASYMGVPFYFENDSSEGGRALAVHEFFDADDPYVEDLGRQPRYFSGVAYVASDLADSRAVDLELTFETEGPGTLVVPIMGPVSVHCKKFKRTADKDKLGYITFTVHFVRAGATAALTSSALLGQQIFDAADALATALAGTFPAALTLSNPADYIIAAAIGEVGTLAAAIEGVRIVNPVDADISAAVSACDAAMVTAAPTLIVYGNPAAAALSASSYATLIGSPNAQVAAIAAAIDQLLAASPPIDSSITDPTATLVAVIIANVRQLGDGMAANTDAGAGALLALAQSLSPSAPAASTATANQAASAANAAAVTAIGRVAALTAWGEALQRQTYASRSDAVAARALFAETIGDELENWTGAAGFAVYTALQDLQGAVVGFLTAAMANLAPVVEVIAPQSMPALWWAWRLYRDPSRAVDLSLRNAVMHPSYMPTSFEALAPGYAAPNLPTVWPAP